MAAQLLAIAAAATLSNEDGFKRRMPTSSSIVPPEEIKRIEQEQIIREAERQQRLEIAAARARARAEEQRRNGKADPSLSRQQRRLAERQYKKGQYR